MKVAAIQHDILWEDAPSTRERVRPWVAQAAASGAGLIVLPEMFATGFSMSPERVAEDEGGPTEQFLLEQARTYGVHVVASIAQRGPDGNYRNNAVLARPTGEVVRYAKIHPFSYAGEHERYAAGDGWVTTRIGDLRTTLFVCYDLRFGDEFWALAADTDLYVVPANWPAVRQAHWRALLQARAIENQAYVIGVNRVGLARDLPHAGGSVVFDPSGVALAEAGAAEGLLLAEVEARVVADTRRNFPFLADRRAAQPDAVPAAARS